MQQLSNISLNSRGLADVNGDGQFDFNEFSIACKLITNKLKGLELPKTLPPSMMTMFPGMPPQMMGQPNMAGMARAGNNLEEKNPFLFISHIFGTLLFSFLFQKKKRIFFPTFQCSYIYLYFFPNLTCSEELFGNPLSGQAGKFE